MNVENPIGLIPRASLITTFNDLGKVERIEDGNTLQSLAVEYGPDQERWISTLSRNNQVTSTRIYFDDYEKTTDAAGTHEIYYLGNHSIYVRDDGGDFRLTKAAFLRYFPAVNVGKELMRVTIHVDKELIRYEYK